MSTAGVAARPEGRTVVLVEDDADIAEVISYQLGRSGLSVAVARTGEEGLHQARRGADLVLLDLNLPGGMDGLEVCRLLRGQATTAHIPVIVVSARADEVDRVLGLEMGADDFVPKPFSVKELVARVRAALRRAESRREGAAGYWDEDLEIDFDAFLVRFRGQELRLTAREFDLLRALVERPGRVLSRERLRERLQGYDREVDLRSVDAHVRRLRKKLGPARDHVETVVGVGYRFVRHPRPAGRDGA